MGRFQFVDSWTAAPHYFMPELNFYLVHTRYVARQITKRTEIRENRDTREPRYEKRTRGYILT